MKYILFVSLFFLTFNSLAQTEITNREINKHILYLSSDKNKGRYPGTKENRRVIAYISRDFRKAGIRPLQKSYLQPFEARLRVKKGVTDTPVVNTGNIVAIIPGRDPQLSKEYLVLGAHYDHLGTGGVSSRKPDTTAIHPGADDNASGTAALLEIAEKLSANRAQLKRSIVLIAFGAEEQGLLGSKYFTENPLVPLSQIKLMINMDMVGRLNDEKHVYVGGAGTFDGGVELMTSLGRELGLNPVVHSGGVGGSDHVSFYKKNISVMGIHTGGHVQYHTPEDSADLINVAGEKLVCDYIYNAIINIANKQGGISFINQD